MGSWLKEKADFDYFIGSVHYITDTFDIDNPNKKAPVGT